MNSNNLSTKRISNDIKEIYQNPIEGIGIISLNNDIKKYIINIMLLTGPYKDYCLQLLLTFPDNYPISPPKILIYPEQLFDNLYHHHIFNDESKDENGKCFKKLCIDLLDNDFLSTKNENTGWNPSYTLSTLLMQVQIFLSDPDLSENSMPKSYQIKELLESMNNYKRAFYLKDENREIIHTWKDPYPKMYFKENKDDKIINTDENLISNDNVKIIKENLTCYISKLSIFDQPNIILGYPIVKKYNNKIYPIPEILSYEGYLTQISNEQFDGVMKSLKSANNQYYNNWLPIYINKQNFELNKQTILNSFSIIKFGFSGEKNYDFKPEYIYEIMFKLFNQMINDFREKKLSSSYLRAFFQYILLYNKLSELYPIQLNEYFNIDSINDFNIIQKIDSVIISSFFKNLNVVENLLNKLNNKKKNNLAFKIFKEKENSDLISPDKFLEYLEEEHLINKLYEIIRFERNIFLYNGKNFKKIIKKIIYKSFKDFFLKCDEVTQNRLEKFILNNIKFYKFIDLSQFFNDKFGADLEQNIEKQFNNLIIIIYLKKIINKKNFINQLEYNYGVYLEIDNIIKKINEISDGFKIFYDKEIENNDKNLFDKIIKIIRELYILNYNNSNGGIYFNYYHEFDYKDLVNYEKGFYSALEPSYVVENKVNRVFIGMITAHQIFFNKKNMIQFEKQPHSFSIIENMELEDLKYIYLYCLERLKKCINPNNNYLSLVESIFIDNTINYNWDFGWINYIIERQAYEYENMANIIKHPDILDQRQIIKLFYEAKELNKKLFSKKYENLRTNLKTTFRSKEYFYSLILKNIIEFAEKLTGEKIINHDELFISYYGKKNLQIKSDDSLIEKLKEIYDTGNITLLTFYEFIWFEEHYNICDGFLSSLRSNVLYNFRMRENIKKIKNIKEPKINRKNYKEKIFKKNLDRNIYRLKYNKKISFRQIKPIRIKNKKKSNFRYSYNCQK